MQFSVIVATFSLRGKFKTFVMEWNWERYKERNAQIIARH